jgi:hypothetical protein
MLPIPIVEVIAGTTLKATWINSGTTVSSLDSVLLDGNDAVINTYAAVASGNGHYYAVHHVPSSGYPWLVNRWIGFIESNTYVYRQLVRVHRLEV